MTRNPFTNRKMIRDRIRFYGRGEELRQAIDHIVSSECCSLVGEPKIGKSSLLWFLRDEHTVCEMGIDPQNYVMVYFDFQLDPGITQLMLWQTLLAELVGTVTDDALCEEIQRLRRQTSIRFTALRSVLKKVTGEGYKVVFLFDEFDYIVDNRSSFDVDFFSGLRSLANELGVVYVTASRIGLRELLSHDRRASSPFFNIFAEIRLGLLKKREATALILQSNMPIEPSLSAEVNYILQEAGGHPFVLQILCYHLFNAKGDQDVLAQNDLGKAASRSLDQLFPFFEDIWSRMQPAQKQAILVTAGLKPATPIDRIVLRELGKQGYVVFRDEGPSIFCELFGDFLRTRTEQTSGGRVPTSHTDLSRGTEKLNVSFDALLSEEENMTSGGFRKGHALIIGIANYPRVHKLPETVLKDARDIHDLLRSPTQCGYLDTNVQLLLDDQATAEGIQDGMCWLAGLADSSDTVLIFFSGHGGRVESGLLTGDYLIPYNYDAANPSTTAISGEELTGLLRNIRAQRLVIFFDCCYSGGAGETKAMGLEQVVFKSRLEETYYERLAQGIGRVIVASSRSDEESLVLQGMDNSLFAHCLLKALQGGARTRCDGLIRVFDVFDYISEEVPAHGPQHPIFRATDLENNFPIALYLGGKQVEKGLRPALSQPTAVDRRALRKAMVRAFSLEELDVMCADVEQALLDDGIELQVNLEMVGGTSKSGRVLNLIRHLDRRGYLIYLVTFVRRERPGVI
jgi:hypothetical protein